MYKEVSEKEARRLLLWTALYSQANSWGQNVGYKAVVLTF